MDLNQLPLFLAVADAASFSGAAQRLALPKSSVSRGIARLEAEVGIKLLHRTTRRVSLTSAGSAFYQRVAPLVAGLEHTVSELRERDAEPSGDLRLTATVDVGANVLAEILTRFCLRHPAIRVELTLTDRLVDLVAEGFDAALRIASRPLKDSSLMARKVGRINLGLYAAPQYLARRGTPRSPRELGEHDWVASGFVESRLRVRGRMQCGDMFFVREALRAGAGMGVLPAFLAEPAVTAGDLVRVLPRWTFLSTNLFFLYPGGKALPRKVTALRDFVAEALQVRPVP